MGFKIESIAEVSNIANSMSTAYDVVKGFGKSARNSLEELPNIISGQNVDTVLNEFRTNIAFFLVDVEFTVKRLNEFIASQARGYSENEETIANELSKITEEFENISFE